MPKEQYKFNKLIKTPRISQGSQKTVINAKETLAPAKSSFLNAV